MVDRSATMSRPNKYRRRENGSDMRAVSPEVHDMRAPPVKPMSEAPAPRPPDRLEPAPAGGLAPRPTNAPTPQTAAVIRCAYCRSDRVRHNGTANGYKYYRCMRCCDMDTGDATTFKVTVVDPLAK
jgi:hypothetical protein